MSSVAEDVSSSKAKAKYFLKRLAAWGKHNLRDFPWRKTNDPFHILLAETMLRRTNAPQVIPTYLSIVNKYFDPQSLVKVPRREVLRALRPIGLEWRAESIRRMAEVVMSRFGGTIPSTYKELCQLPGVGDYVASAVCCFAFGKPMPIVDTNTVRVVGRYFGFQTHSESRRRKFVREAVVAITNQRHTRTYNFAFLDFAALLCECQASQRYFCLAQASL